MKAFNKIFFGIAAFVLFSIGDTYAQGGYFEDALRFSQYRSTGTARVSGIGGVQTSLGGDISNIHGNPAGLGFFRRSEFGLTASYSDTNSETSFLSQVQNNSTSNFSLPNLGVVISRAKGPLEVGDWRGGSFGISVNRMNTFNSDYGYFSSRLDQGSMLDYYVDLYNDIGVPGGTNGLAFDAFLINPDDAGGFDYSPNATDRLEKSEIVEKEGSISQVTFAYGGNYKNKIFLGASLGVSTFTYRSTRTYNEDFLDNSNNSTLFSSLQENLFLNGSGVNLGLGVIYKPVDSFNIGLNFQSPTWSIINDEYDADIFADFNPPYQDPEFGSIAESDAETDIFISRFNLRTPLRLGTGVTYFFGKHGFISADLDYLDYSSANLRSNDFNVSEDNLLIRDLYTNTINYRVGGEYRLDILRIRAGYAFYGDPFGSNDDFDRSMTQISGGVGVRLEKFSVDLGIVSSQFADFNDSYPTSPVAQTDNRRIMGLLSLGFNF